MANHDNGVGPIDQTIQQDEQQDSSEMYAATLPATDQLLVDETPSPVTESNSPADSTPPSPNNSSSATKTFVSESDVRASAALPEDEASSNGPFVSQDRTSLESQIDDGRLDNASADNNALPHGSDGGFHLHHDPLQYVSHDSIPEVEKDELRNMKSDASSAPNDALYGKQENMDNGTMNSTSDEALQTRDMLQSNLAEVSTAVAADPASQNAATMGQASASDVIDLLDSDDDNEQEVANENGAASTKRRRLDDATGGGPPLPPSSGAVASYMSRTNHAPEWFQQRKLSANVLPPQGRGEAGGSLPLPNPLALGPPPPQPLPTVRLNEPTFFSLPEQFQPVWNQLLPSSQRKPPPQQQPYAAGKVPKIYQLSLLNVNEFTIEGVSPRWDMPASPVSGLRVPIRQISRKHGKSVYERDKEGGGKWRIPLGAYQDFASFLRADPNTQVIGIPPNQLQIASLERARQEKGYPTPEQLIEFGIPKGLANKLAPFQRGGVEFVKEKGGRALIADDMGLGKTIQGVASMAMYHSEWPVLILSPSGARYHWESEFKQWLGIYAEVNKREQDAFDRMFPDSRKTTAASNVGPLLHDRQINVLTSSKSVIFPYEDTRVVICSYGLSSALIEGGKITKEMFRCAIVDESHMLKNKATKRTSLLLPILHATNRCVLLSGTPALARPLELWPQLSILGTEKHGWGSDEQDFIDKYVKNGNSRRSAELHTMLRGTVMIRRLKDDILKDMPRKIRKKAEINAMTSIKQRREFVKLMTDLRESKGALGKLARIHQTELDREAKEMDRSMEARDHDMESDAQHNSENSLTPEGVQAVSQLQAEMNERIQNSIQQMHQTVAQQWSHLGVEELDAALLQFEGEIRTNVTTEFNERLTAIRAHYGNGIHPKSPGDEAGDSQRSNLLSRLYGLTGDVKIPFIVESLERWLKDPTKGKICIFAHHISVLNAIQEGAGLSNDGKTGRKCIRIDGSTLPRTRQDQIVAFQSDPSIRVALLGITAAGVAVTLTASSTVWFTELFWTPAIMIQAEDRCHRIGQQAQVHCTYFVAKGTLDDVLWKLLEKKFRDLGEFVEGMEKLKLVVNRTYKSFKEFQSDTFDAADDASFSDDGADDDDVDFGQELALDNDLVHDIENLGEEERRMLRQADPDAEDGDGEPVDVDTKLSANGGISGGGQTIADISGTEGTSEVDAIALSDDEGEDNASADMTGLQEKISSQPIRDQNNTGGEALPVATEGNVKAPIPPSDRRSNGQDMFSNCRVYSIVFGDPSLGLDITLVDGRVVVARISSARLERFGPQSKPAVGDILVMIAGHTLNLVNNLAQTLQYLKAALKRPPVELVFMEAPLFVKRFRKHTMKSMERLAKKVQAQQMASAPLPPPLVAGEPPPNEGTPIPPPATSTSSDGGVIDLLLDD